jgi:hypothetical protein
MSKEIVPAFTVTDMQTMAQSVAKSRLFGLDEPQAFTLMMLAQAEGIHPVKAVQRYHVIQGRPAMRADAMLADFQKIGGRLEWTTESDDVQKCEAIFHHPVHAPGGKPVRFTMEDAKRAGLDKKEIWKQYPAAMMRSRVISTGIKMYAPAIVAGLYTPEEVGSFTDPIEVVAQVPEHHAVHHDNGTGHGSGAYAPPEVVTAYQSFLDATVSEVNSKWLDHLTDPKTGEMLSADGELTNTWELSGHLLKWARSMDWVKAPQDIRAGQRDKFAAVAWQDHMAEFMEEARRYLRLKWVTARKKAKTAKAQGKRDNPETLELIAENAAIDELLTTEAGARG